MKTWEVFLVAALCVLGAGWWLFGFSTSRPFKGGGTVQSYRVFGQVVRIDADFDGDGRIDESFRYSRNCPSNECPPRLIVADRNRDGRWDTWIRDAGTDAQGYALHRYEVDTNNDGRPDWIFVAHATEATQHAIVARRGY